MRTPRQKNTGNIFSAPTCTDIPAFSRPLKLCMFPQHYITVRRQHLFLGRPYRVCQSRRRLTCLIKPTDSSSRPSRKPLYWKCMWSTIKRPGLSRINAPRAAHVAPKDVLGEKQKTKSRSQQPQLLPHVAANETVMSKNTFRQDCGPARRSLPYITSSRDLKCHSTPAIVPPAAHTSCVSGGGDAPFPANSCISESIRRFPRVSALTLANRTSVRAHLSTSAPAAFAPGNDTKHHRHVDHYHRSALDRMKSEGGGGGDGVRWTTTPTIDSHGLNPAKQSFKRATCAHTQPLWHSVPSNGKIDHVVEYWRSTCALRLFQAHFTGLLQYSAALRVPAVNGKQAAAYPLPAQKIRKHVVSRCYPAEARLRSLDRTIRAKT